MGYKVEDLRKAKEYLEVLSDHLGKLTVKVEKASYEHSDRDVLKALTTLGHAVSLVIKAIE